MTTKRLSQRRQRNRELARQDSANRCAICKREIHRGAVLVWGDDRQFCSTHCYERMQERERLGTCALKSV